MAVTCAKHEDVLNNNSSPHCFKYWPKIVSFLFIFLFRARLHVVVAIFFFVFNHCFLFVSFSLTLNWAKREIYETPIYWKEENEEEKSKFEIFLWTYNHVELNCFIVRDGCYMCRMEFACNEKRSLANTQEERCG